MTKHPLTCVLAAALFAAVSGCATSKPVPEAKAGPVPAGAFVRAWHAEVDLGGKSVKALNLNNGRLFVTGANNVVVALTPAGSVTARVTVAEPIEKLRYPFFAADRIVVPTSSTLEVFKANGLRERSIPLESPIRGNAAPNGSELYVAVDGKGNGRMAKVSLTSGYPDVRWELITGLVTSTPMVHEGVLYAATEQGVVYALTAERQAYWPQSNGLPDGLFHAQDRIVADIFVDDSGVYVPCLDGRFYVLDANNGRIRWRFTAGVPLDATPVVTEDSAYLFVPGRGLCAFDKTAPTIERSPRWANRNARQVLNDDKQNVYVRLDDDRLAALDKKTGDVKFISNTRDLKFFITHVDPKDPTLFAATASGQVIAITPVTQPGMQGVLVDAR